MDNCTVEASYQSGEGTLWHYVKDRKPRCCPVCNGKGILPHGFYNTTDYYSSSSTAPEICRSCNEVGYIWY